MKKFIKNNIFGFILGAVLFGGVGTVLATVILASNISYTPSDTNWNVNNVQDALDYLNAKANTKLNIDGLTNLGFEKNSNNTIFANSSGVCIIRNQVISCFKANDFDNEKIHVQEVFSDASCVSGSSDATCVDRDLDLHCEVWPDRVRCWYETVRSGCIVNNGSVNCY